jgi:hypothetical protein
LDSIDGNPSVLACKLAYLARLISRHPGHKTAFVSLALVNRSACKPPLNQLQLAVKPLLASLIFKRTSDGHSLTCRGGNVAKTVMIVALIWSLMRSSETFLNDSIFTRIILFVALTALVRVVLSPVVPWASAPDGD